MSGLTYTINAGKVVLEYRATGDKDAVRLDQLNEAIECLNRILAQEKSERVDADSVLDNKITTEVNAAIDTLMGGAPETLDTLNEIALALGNDDDIATTILNQITTVQTNLDNLEISLDSKIQEEVGNRTDAIEELNSLISGVVSDSNTEDVRLQTEIDGKLSKGGDVGSGIYTWNGPMKMNDYVYIGEAFRWSANSDNMTLELQYNPTPNDSSTWSVAYPFFVDNTTRPVVEAGNSQFLTDNFNITLDVRNLYSVEGDESFDLDSDSAATANIRTELGNYFSISEDGGNNNLVLSAVSTYGHYVFEHHSPATNCIKFNGDDLAVSNRFDWTLTYCLGAGNLGSKHTTVLGGSRTDDGRFVVDYTASSGTEHKFYFAEKGAYDDLPSTNIKSGDRIAYTITDISGVGADNLGIELA